MVRLPIKDKLLRDSAVRVLPQQNLRFRFGHHTPLTYIVRMTTFLKLAVLLLSLILFSSAQTQKFVGISEVSAAGTLKDDKYTNAFLEFSVKASNSTQTLNPSVQTSAQRARLVQIEAKPTTWENTYTFAVIADLLAVNPLTKKPSDYIQALRRSLEHQGFPTVREEFPIKISGLDFTGAVFQEQVPNGRKYYRGIYTTFRKGYILTFDVEAPSEEKLNELVTTAVKFEVP